MKENRQIVRKRRKQDFTMDDLNDEEETEGVDEFKSTAKPTENRNRPPKRRSTRNIQYKVRGEILHYIHTLSFRHNHRVFSFSGT